MGIQRSIGLRETQPIGVDIPPLPIIPQDAVAVGWGAAYKVGDDLPEGSIIHVDYSAVDGVLGVGAAVQEIQGLDFGIGGPSDTPWEDPPFNGSMASSGTVDASRNFHVTPGVVAGHDFSAAGFKGMQVVTKRYPNAIDWASGAGWSGTEYHEDGGLAGEGGMDFHSHLGWRFVDQPSVVTDISVYIELVNTTTGEDFAWGFCDILTTETPVVSPTFDKHIKFPGNEVDIRLSRDIIAPSGLAIITIIGIDDSWPDPSDAAASWPVISDSTGSPENFAKGRVLTAAHIST